MADCVCWLFISILLIGLKIAADYKRLQTWSLACFKGTISAAKVWSCRSLLQLFYGLLCPIFCTWSMCLEKSRETGELKLTLAKFHSSSASHHEKRAANFSNKQTSP